MENFEPEIVAFCCHYCAYTAADMAGSKRISYPPNVKIIRVPCTGKVDAIHIIIIYRAVQYLSKICIFEMDSVAVVRDQAIGNRDILGIDPNAGS